LRGNVREAWSRGDSRSLEEGRKKLAGLEERGRERKREMRERTGGQPIMEASDFADKT